MTLRNKLLGLLLVVSLIPFGLTFALRQWSGRSIRTHVSGQVEVTLDQYAKATLRQWLQESHQIFRRDALLSETLVRSQAREVGLLMTESDGGPVNGTRMQELYADIQQLSASDFFRQSTVWLNGTCQVVPTSQNLEEKDLREEFWFQRAVQAPGIVRVGPKVDALTGEPLFTIALAVQNADGEVIAVTALHRTVSQIFEHIIMPMQWGNGAEILGVVVDPNSVTSIPELVVVLHPGYSQIQEGGDSHDLDRIVLNDSAMSQHMIHEMLLGDSGIQRMPYQGKDTLWAYGQRLPTGMIPLVLVPYDEVTELATNMEEFILGQSYLWWSFGGGLLLAIVTVVFWIGFKRARDMVEPVKILTEASAQLAAGDFRTHIDIRTGDELQILGQAFNEIGPHLQEREQLKRSLELAGAIQRSLLPQENPQLPNFEIAGQCVYCDQSGGDYYDFIALDSPERLGIALGDVTGHGIGAALLMATARGIFRSLAVEYQLDLAELLNHFNRQFVPDCNSDKFITLFYGILNSQERSLIWASGGHDPALWYQCNNDTFEELSNTGPLLGIIDGVNYRQSGPVNLSSGDILIVGTDGIWEAPNAKQERFGQERLLDLIKRGRDLSAPDLCAGITQAVQNLYRL